MDDLFEEEAPEDPRFAGLSARLPLLNNFLVWFSSIVSPSKEEQENAGVYLGGEGRD